MGDGTISSLKSGSRELVSVDGSTRAGENSMKYSVAVDPANPYNILSMNGLTKGERVYQCFEFTLDNLKLFKGAKITSINVTTGGTQNGRNTVERANLFMSHDITAAPFYKKTVTFAETALKENEFALETPYEISDDQPLYIGYYFLCNGKNEGYIPVDGYPSAEPGGLIATSAGSKWPGKKIGRTSLPVMAHAVSLLRWRATTFLRIMSAFSPRSSRRALRQAVSSHIRS